MEKHNTVHAIFASGEKVAEIKDDVWQYDFGQVLQISGLSLPPVVEVHYANKGKDIALPQTGVTEGGITTAPIPNEILEEKGAFTAYIFVTDGESGETCYTINGYVNKRPRVKGFNTPEDQEILHAAVGAVNAAAERAESAETKATEAANQTAEDAKQTAADRAETERLVESVSGIGEQVIKVENLTKQAQTSATNAALSEQAAKTAETNAQAAQAGAETAEGNAELAEQRTKASEQAVEKAKQLVTQMGQEVLDNKNHVDQTVQAFDQTAQQAVADVNNAGQTQTERVQSAGNTATESVKAAQTAATQAIETAKTEATDALQVEGTTQTGNVAAEGAKQVQAVQQAAQEIVVDREQIQVNKVDIAEIKEEMDNLSPAIVDTATGESIVVEDSSDNRFKGLSLYGKSTQVTTTGAQLFNVDAGGCGWIKPETGEFMESISNYVSGFIPVKNSTQYYCNFNISPYVYSYDAEKHFLRKETYNGNFLTNSDVFFIRFAISSDKEIALSKAKKIMLCEGDVEKPHEPYTGGKPSPSVEYPQEIANAGVAGTVEVNVFGVNLINFPEGELINNGITYTSSKGAIEVKGKTENSSSQTDMSMLMCVLPKKLKGNFYLSGTSLNVLVNVKIALMDGKIKYFGKGKFVLDGHEKEVKVYIRVDPNKTVNETIYPMINIGDVQLPWEPYRELQTLTIPTPNGLPGIKVDSGGNYTDMSGQQWVCDTVEYKRGKAVMVQRVERINIKTLKWSLQSRLAEFGGVFSFARIEKPTLFKVVVSGTISNICRLGNPHNMVGDYVWALTNNNISEIRFGFADRTIDSLEKFKNLLDGLPEAYAMYCLSEPIEHDLPPEVIEAYKKLHTNYPVTTILNDAGAGMKVEYVADTKNYTDNKIAESVKNQMQNFTNLLSLMPMETQAAMIENDVNRILESEVTK